MEKQKSVQNKNKDLLKNLGILTVCNFASKILVFLMVPLYTNVLTTAEYGVYDLVITTVSVIFPILSLNIIDAVMRYLMDDNYDKSIVSTTGVALCLISFFLGGVLLAVLGNLEIANGIKGLELFILAYYISYIANQYMVQFAKGLDKVFDMGIAGVLGTFVMIVTNVLFLIVLSFGLKGFFIANILCQFIPAIFLIIRLKVWKYIVIKKIHVDLLKEMLAYSIPLIVTVVGWWVNSGSDRYVVTFFCGAASTGILSVAYKIPSIMNTLQGIFVQVWQISAIKEYGNEDTAVFYGHTFGMVNFLMCLACSVLILLTKPIAHMLYAKEFFQAWLFVPFLLVSTVFNSASGLLGPILSAQRNSKAMMWSGLIGAVVNIVLNIIFVYLWGVQGATIATAISSFGIYEIRRMAVGENILIEHYNIILVTWLILCIQAACEIYMSSHLFGILMLIAILILNHKTLVWLIKSIRQIGFRKK